MYGAGDGVPKDAAKARDWYLKAAAQGFAKAQHNLGVMYDNGDGVQKEEATAVDWYRKAAAQGYAPSQCNLAEMFLNGRGVRRDDIQAYAWYNLAAAQDFQDCAKKRDAIEKRMTLDQKRQAQELSAELFVSIPQK